MPTSHVRRRMAGTRVATRVPADGAEGERFELSIRLTTDNGFRDRRIRPLCHPSSGEGGIRTLDGDIHPHNALAGRRLQPLGHFSASGHRIAEPLGRYPMPSPEGWQSGRMRRSRKPFRAVTSDEGSNPSPSALQAKNPGTPRVLASRRRRPNRPCSSVLVRCFRAGPADDWRTE